MGSLETTKRKSGDYGEFSLCSKCCNPTGSKQRSETPGKNLFGNGSVEENRSRRKPPQQGGERELLTPAEDARFLGRKNEIMKKILVVDDEEHIRDVLCQFFSSLGYLVAAAGSGQEGLNLFLQTTYDLVLTDLDMPGMDGWSLAARIKNLIPDTPVILITGASEDAVIGKTQGCVDSVMFKPFILNDVLKTAEKILEKKIIGH